jgi:hypothetical protein
MELENKTVYDVYSSDCNSLLKPHIYNDIFVATSVSCNIGETAIARMFKLQFPNMTWIATVAHPSMMTTSPLVISPFTKGDVAHGYRKNNYLVVASQQGMVTKLMYSDDGRYIAMVGAINLHHKILEGASDPAHSRMFYLTENREVVRLDLITMDIRILPSDNLTAIVACVISPKYRRATKILQNKATGEYRIANFNLDSQQEEGTTDIIPQLYDSQGIYSFILDSSEDNAYFIKSCTNGKTLVQVYVPTLVVKASFLWDKNYVAVAQTPIITDQYLYYATAQLTQTTEFLRFDLSTGPNFTTTKVFSTLRYVPRVMDLDHTLPQYAYIALDTAVRQMVVTNDAAMLTERRKLVFSELDYAPGAVFVASNIDVDHNLLFLASSNGLIFVIDVDGETTLGFKIAMGMLGAAFGAIFLVILFIFLIRNSYRLRKLRVREVQMERLLEERLLDDSSNSSYSHNEPQKSWLINFNELQFEDRISEGSFGVIFKGRLRGIAVAIKKLKVDGEIEFHQEAKVLASLRHPNTVLFMGICVTEQYNFMVTEYCGGGSLESWLYTRRKRNGKCFHKAATFKKKVKLLMDVISGMVYLHTMTDPQNTSEAKPLIHRDLKVCLCDIYNNNCSLPIFFLMMLKMLPKYVILVLVSF